MLLDDRADYPMTFPIESTFRGRFRPADLRQALTETLRRHPLVNARVEAKRGAEPVWVPLEDATPQIDWAEAGVALRADAEVIDLSREPGLKVWVRESGETSTLGLIFHHCACDGIGGLQFLGDLLAHYAQHVSGAGAAKLLDLDPKLLLSRDRFKAKPASNSNPVRLAWDVVREVARVLAKSPLVLAPAKGRGHIDGNPASLRRYTLERHQFRRLRQSANSADATLNDLLLRDLFVVLAAHSRESGASGKDCLRILMPTSLRQSGDEKMSAANLLGYAFLTRSLDQCESPDALLDSIRKETAEIRRLNLGVFFLESARWIVRSRWLARRVLDGKRTFSTAVLTNLGDPARRFTARFPREQRKLVCGNVQLLQTTGVPPLRSTTRLAVSANSYGGELTIGLRCDPHTFALDDAQSLLERFGRQLLRSAETDSAEPAEYASPSNDAVGG